MGFGVVDVSDPYYNSGLLVDGVLVTTASTTPNYYGFGGWQLAGTGWNESVNPNNNGILPLWMQNMGGIAGAAQLFPLGQPPAGFNNGVWNGNWDVIGEPVNSLIIDTVTGPRVPEPAGLTLLAVGGAVLLTRRVHRKVACSGEAESQPIRPH